MIKSYTDISQSKKLAEFLPLESADMCCFKNQNGSISCYAFPFSQGNKAANPIPCWSLSALLGVLPNGNMLIKTAYGEYYCLAEDIMTKHYENPIDACYELILKLKELKML